MLIVQQMERISTHITYSEAIKSDTAKRMQLRNTPTEEQLENMTLLANKVFEPLREYFREPVRISSFFRSQEVNKSVGGSTTSQHTTGEAMDICAFASSGYTNADLFYYVLEKLVFDQLIWEFGTDRNPDWVHVSYSAKGKNRRKALKAIRVNGKVSYKPFAQS